MTFSSVSNATMIMVAGILPSWPDESTVEIKNIFKVLKRDQQAFGRDYNIKTDDSWESKQKSLHGNSSWKEFTAVSFLLAMSLKPVQPMTWESPFFPHHRSILVQLSCLIRKKGRPVCLEILFLYQLLTKTMSRVRST